ncbi:MAG: alanine:cation symporter family protein [Candidatus Competibacteraceae bacterium]|nr:alanine:cation symporter family protein [Candidatus Competibacteraceae bacterium]MCB1806487.1 alanine:cation symporter family protein [Candidatus Competibacteraceae bacterium]MCB1816140.1 alanine:cation symporter family protein [Candidatus Competibacteraceae bacterium]
MLKNLIAGLAGLLFPLWAVAQEAAEKSMDDRISEAIAPIINPFVAFIFSPLPGSEALLGTAFPWIVLWLVVAATVFTLYFGFIQFRGFGHSVALVRGAYFDPKDAGEVTPFQALATALSGTVGLGNIAGVGVAVYLGGPGATFWMILAGLLGMAAKFTECILGVHYRNEYPDGTVSGGPMYYLSKGLAERGMGGFGKVLAVFFAICCIGGALGGGNMFQANQSAHQIASIFPFFADKGWIFGIIMAVIVGLVIIGGIKSIARVTEKIVPFMAAIYVGSALLIILLNIDAIGTAVNAIIDGAFSPTAVAGGAVGALIQGFKRAAFSNEAGIGSASIAHSAVQTKHPVTEGYVALLEPFIDTVVICTMTSLVIIITGSWVPDSGVTGIALTAQAFSSNWGGFNYVLAVAAVLFAFSTMISWSYYGLKAWTYLFGEGAFKEVIFKLLFCIFVIIGASMGLGPVIDFSDAMIFAMGIFNVIGLYLLMPKVKELLRDYQSRLASGEFPRMK